MYVESVEIETKLKKNYFLAKSFQKKAHFRFNVKSDKTKTKTKTALSLSLFIWNRGLCLEGLQSLCFIT